MQFYFELRFVFLLNDNTFEYFSSLYFTVNRYGNKAKASMYKKIFIKNLYCFSSSLLAFCDVLRGLNRYEALKLILVCKIK